MQLAPLQLIHVMSAGGTGAGGAFMSMGSGVTVSCCPCLGVPLSVGAAAIAGAASTPATIAVDSVSTVADRERRPKTRQL